MPPYLAGRDNETKQFLALLDQDPILNNLILTGLRGVGKTVLLETFKPLAIQRKWMWVGTDFSESASVSEETLAQRILADLSVATSGIKVKRTINQQGFSQASFEEKTLGHATLMEIYKSTPGLVSDKIKAVMEFVWFCVSQCGVRGLFLHMMRPKQCLTTP